jgi:hypothetical protein
MDVETVMDKIDVELATLDPKILVAIYNMIISPSIRYNSATDTYNEIN